MLAGGGLWIYFLYLDRKYPMGTPRRALKLARYGWVESAENTLDEHRDQEKRREVFLLQVRYEKGRDEWERTFCIHGLACDQYNMDGFWADTGEPDPDMYLLVQNWNRTRTAENARRRLDSKKAKEKTA